MRSINFILGKPEYEDTEPSFELKTIVEAYPQVQPMKVTYYANAKQFSRRTPRDKMIVVGKLYKGYVEDENFIEEQKPLIRKKTK